MNANTFVCFEENCGGMVEKQSIVYKTKLSNGDTIVIANLQVEKCNKCGEILLDNAASTAIESAIKQKYPNYYDHRS